MGISVKRIILTIILAVLFVIVFGWVIMMQNHATLVSSQSVDETLRREEFMQAKNDIEFAWRIMEKDIREQYQVDAALLAVALRNIIEESEDEAIALYSSGAVIKVENGKITAPEETDRKLGLAADLFEGSQGLFASPEEANTLVVYSRIRGPYYYVEWHEDTSIRQEVEDALDIPDILRKEEAAYHVCALCYAEDPSAENGARILYCNDIITDLEEVFQKAGTQDLSSYETEESLSTQFGVLSLQDVTFHYVKGEIPQIGGSLLLMTIQPNLYVKALSQGTYMFTALILFFAALITAGIWLYPYIRNNVLPIFMEKWYRPSNVRRYAALYGIVGAILIFLSGLLIYALNELYDDTAGGKERLRTVEESLSMYSDRVKQNMDRFTDNYLDYGFHIAEGLDNYPQLRDSSVLETLSDSISASSITLYDANGDETVSSSEYIGLSLGDSPESSTYDFRRILNGVPSIVHEVETDEITGESGIRIAVRIRDTEDPSRYGVMVICVDPVLLESSLSQMTDSVLRNLSGENVILCVADRETGEILSSGREDLVHRNVSALGLDVSQLQSSVIRNVNTEEGSMFITTSSLDSDDGLVTDAQTDHLTAVYAVAKESNTFGMFASALTGCGLFLVMYGVLSWMILSGYKDEWYDNNIRTKPAEESTEKLWHGVRNYLISIRPEKIGLITMEIILGLYLLQQIPISHFNTALSRNSVYYYLNSGNWEKGLNLFALAGILLLLGQILLVVIMVRIVLAVISSFVGGKGKTICRLIKSLVMYLALFTFVILALNYLGLSMSTILAAIATLGIAVSLGAQHFVSDIIAGLTMVFEGTVHVGDIVDLGVGMKLYHGVVQEIGLRFIRLLTHDGNIVALSNRDISMTTNMMQMNSICRCEFTISSDYVIEEIEEMLHRELPAIGKQDRRILRGPDYQGILSLDDSRMTVLITAECREQDLFDVQQILIRSVQRIFKQNGYDL